MYFHLSFFHSVRSLPSFMTHTTPTYTYYYFSTSTSLARIGIDAASSATALSVFPSVMAPGRILTLLPFPCSEMRLSSLTNDSPHHALKIESLATGKR